MYKKSILLNKPFYIGTVVLELSKHLMYNFFYEFIIKNYGNENIELL